jgi:hypothetical protein
VSYFQAKPKNLGSYPDEDVCTTMAAQVKQDLILSGFA